MALRMETLDQIATLMFARIEDYSTKIYGKASELNGVIKVPVILAKEMVQRYHRSEFPQWIQDQIPTEMDFISIFKPFAELEKAIVNVDRLPIVLDHRWIDNPETDMALVGYVSDLKACNKRRIIYGNAYYDVRKITQTLYDKIKKIKIIDVSIGALVGFGSGGMFNDQAFMFHQKNFTLNHLATLEHDRGRCPAGICGLNMDSAVKSASDVRAIITDQGAGKLMTTTLNFLPGVNLITPEIVKYVTTVRPIYESPPSTITDSKENKNLLGNQLMPMTPEQILAMQTKMADMAKENLALKESLASTKITDLDAANTKLTAELSAIKNDHKVKDAELAALKKTAAEDKVKLDAIAEQEKTVLVDKLFMVRNDKGKAFYKQEDLKAKSLDKLKELDEIHAGLGSYPSTDAAKKQAGFTKPAQTESNSGSESNTEVGNATVSMDALFVKEEVK